MTDIFNSDDQIEILTNEHNRAHRSVLENTKQVLDIKKKLKVITNNCKTCHLANQRHPQRHTLNETPIPSAPGEILHIDIYNTDKQFF